MASEVVNTYLAHLFDLSGKTAVVIGGTGVLGGGICETLSRAGAHVIVVGRNEANGKAQVAKITEHGGSAELYVGDTADVTCLQEIESHVKSSGKQVDILVNSAGTNSATPFFEITDEEWDHIFNVNLKIVRQACQVFGKSMIEQKINGSIINVASLSAITPLIEGLYLLIQQSGSPKSHTESCKRMGTSRYPRECVKPWFFSCRAKSKSTHTRSSREDYGPYSDEPLW